MGKNGEERNLLKVFGCVDLWEENRSNLSVFFPDSPKCFSLHIGEKTEEKTETKILDKKVLVCVYIKNII